MSDHLALLVEELRQALNKLRDNASLRSSPLVARLGLERSDDPAVALREALLRAIDSLRPATGASSADSRLYTILFERYVQGRTQEAVAARLSITSRHLRREQAAAVRVLARFLDLQYELGAGSGAQLDGVGEGAPTGQSTEVNREMLWLADAHRHETCDVASVLTEVAELARGMAAERDIGLSLACTADVGRALIPRTVLRQVVLNLLAAAVENLGHGGRIHVEARPAEGQVAIAVLVRREGKAPWRDLSALGRAADVSRQLARLFGGQLAVSEVDDLLVAKILLPGVDGQVRVLAIDDNTDTLRLWRRYVQRTRFALVEATDPDQALALAARLQPALVVMDVMLPGIDGWELLRRFRQHVATAYIPIIVCTVLPQRQLALSLGAADFIQKPATGGEFRAALERQIAAVERRAPPRGAALDPAPTAPPDV